jgi:hypothetical protein
MKEKLREALSDCDVGWKNAFQIMEGARRRKKEMLTQL